MKIRVMSNNRNVLQKALQCEYDFWFVDGSAMDVLKHGQQLIEEGWALSADPLAGYNAVNNPYRTIFLEKPESGNRIAKDLSRLETALQGVNNPKRFAVLTDKLRGEYCELDYSIAAGIMDGLLKNFK